EIPKGPRFDEGGDVEEVLRRDLRDDAAAEEEEHDVARDRRVDVPHRLEGDDVAEGVPPPEAERGGGRELAAGDRGDAGPHHLGGVCAEMDREREDRRGPCGEAESDAGEAEEDEEERDQKRRVAEELDIRPDEAAGPA